MNVVKRLSEKKLARHLLATVIVFVVMFLYRKLVLPHFPGLDSWFGSPLVAGAVALSAWWLVSRGMSAR